MRVVVTGERDLLVLIWLKSLKVGHEVLVIDNLSSGKSENIKDFHDSKNFQFIQGSVTDLNLLRKVFKGADCISHQAAIASVQRSVENPIATNETNVNGMLNVLIAARDCGVNKVIYASSAAVYGDTPLLPIREDIKPNPKSPYAVSKLAGEYYCRSFTEMYGLQTICLSYFNIYGPKQDPYSDYAAVIPRFITRILNNQPPILFGDGTQTRDFAFVKDVARVNILAMKKNVGGVFNIASGEKMAIKELAITLLEIAGVKCDLIYDNPRPGDIKDSVADISSARNKLNYAPRFNLTKGLKETIRWALKNSEGGL